jgi:hypothetical protein
MNLFYLDENIDKCAEYHIDKHVVKMPTEAAQLLTTAVWVDKFLGFRPRALNDAEMYVINNMKSREPSIEERTFTRFLPTHINHPCAIWVRSSMDNFEWTYGYCESLNSEWRYRYNHSKNHKSFDATMALPYTTSLIYNGITKRPQCMPVEYQQDDPIEAYRLYYMLDKANMAAWKNRPKPHWWEQ